MKNSILFQMCFLLSIPLFLIGCDTDVSQGPEDYFDQGNFSVVLDAQKIHGNGQYRKVVESNETLVIKVQVESPENLERMEITKTVNLEVDSSFENQGVLEVAASGKSFNYIFTYEPSVADVDQLIGFSFRAINTSGNSHTSDLTASVTLSPIDNLVTKRWRWSSIRHVNSKNQPNEEVIADCEKDNSFLFNADDTMSIEFGSNTGTGSCGFDGFFVYTRWYISEDEEFFVMEKYNIFNPSVIEVESYRLVTLTVDKLQLELTVDLSVFGLGLEVYLYTFEPEPRN